MNRHLLSLVLSFCLGETVAAQKVLNPIQFGLFEAETAIERYEVLYKTHCEALERNASVSYKGIDRIDIEIPSSSRSIPLTDITDFAGTSIYVTNHSSNLYLFEMTDKIEPIEVSKEQVDNGDFTGNPSFAKGRFLLVLEDETPWVRQRIGYNYGAIRRDILLIDDGKALNKAVSPYNNEWTRVKAKYRLLPNGKKKISNLKFFRKAGSKKMTFLVTINNQDDVMLSNIEIHTPKDSLKDDAIISISNCTNVKFKHVTIDGTYSRKNWSGYGILMDNVWNSSFNGLCAHGNWGIFGTNNVNKSTLTRCDINRFDIHCYGRDIFFDHCIIRDVYNQFSSVFGEIVFKKCEFINCYPMAFGASYNAYTKFNLTVKDSIIRDIGSKNNFIQMNGYDNPDVNDRPELAQKNWPDIYIDGLTIYTNGKMFYRLSNHSTNDIAKMDESIPTSIELKRVIYERQEK